MVALGGKGASASQMMTVWQPVAMSQKLIIVSSVYTANAENIREDVKALYNVSIKKCYVGGFSQGGIDSGSRAIGTDTGKKWAAIFMLSAPFNRPGSPCFDGAAWKIPIYFSCGTSDSYFYSYVQEHHSIAQSSGHPTELRTPSGGHSTSIHDYMDCWIWISGHSSP
jgi:predicted esterase